MKIRIKLKPDYRNSPEGDVNRIANVAQKFGGIVQYKSWKSRSIVVNIPEEQSQAFIIEVLKFTEVHLFNLEGNMEISTYWYFTYYHYLNGVLCGIAMSENSYFPIAGIMSEFEKTEIDKSPSKIEKRRKVLTWAIISKEEAEKSMDFIDYLYPSTEQK